MKYIFSRLKLGTLILSGSSLIVFGAAGYASVTETDEQCALILESDGPSIITSVPDQTH